MFLFPIPEHHLSHDKIMSAWRCRPRCGGFDQNPPECTHRVCAQPGGGRFFMWSTTPSHSCHLSLMSSKGFSLEIKSCRAPPVAQSCGYWDIFKGVESILADKTAGIVVYTVDNLLMLQWKCANTQRWNFGELLWGLRAIPSLRNAPLSENSSIHWVGGFYPIIFFPKLLAFCHVMCYALHQTSLPLQVLVKVETQFKLQLLDKASLDK